MQWEPWRKQLAKAQFAINENLRILLPDCASLPEGASHSRSDKQFTMNSDKEWHAPVLPLLFVSLWVSTVGEESGTLGGNWCGWKKKEGRGWMWRVEGLHCSVPFEDFIPDVWLPESAGCVQDRRCGENTLVGPSESKWLLQSLSGLLTRKRGSGSGPHKQGILGGKRKKITGA